MKEGDARRRDAVVVGEPAFAVPAADVDAVADLLADILIAALEGNRADRNHHADFGNSQPGNPSALRGCLPAGEDTSGCRGATGAPRDTTLTLAVPRDLSDPTTESRPA